MAVFSTRNLLTSTLFAFANKAARRNLDTFHQQNNSSSFTRRYFQSNIKTRRTDVIQKRRTGFYGDKNFNLVVVFCGIIFPVEQLQIFPVLVYSHIQTFIENIPENWLGFLKAASKRKHRSPVNIVKPDQNSLFKVTRPSFFGGVASYFEALWYPHLYFYRKSNTQNG